MKVVTRIRKEAENGENFVMAETYRKLRTNLQFCGSDVKTILVTSAYENEGKSLTAYRTAESFAELGKRVLLLDCDLRKSVLLRNFQSESRVYGLTHYLTGMQSLENSICVTDVKNLHILFAGAFPPNPAELLSTKGFKVLLDVLRDNYDYVILDAPPLGSVIDAAILAQYCDGTVLVVSEGNVKIRMAQDVVQQLDRTGCRILGVVMNKVGDEKGLFKNGYRRRKGYYGGYNYGYYGKQEKKTEEK